MAVREDFCKENGRDDLDSRVIQCCRYRRKSTLVDALKKLFLRELRRSSFSALKMSENCGVLVHALPQQEPGERVPGGPMRAARKFEHQSWLGSPL